MTHPQQITEKALRDLLLKQTIAMADSLVMCSEPLKAKKLLMECAPTVGEDSKALKEARERVEVKLQHMESDEVYRGLYDREFREACTDQGLLGLPRIQLNRAWVRDTAPKSILSIGFWDGSLEAELLKEDPERTMALSGVSRTERAAAEHLAKMFPGRVTLEGRFDVRRLVHPKKYDMVLALEVLEHVADEEVFLEQVAQATGKHAIISTPSARVWMEQYHIEDHDMAAHVRTYTGFTLGKRLLQNGLAPTIVTSKDGALNAICVPCEGVTEFKESANTDYMKEPLGTFFRGDYHNQHGDLVSAVEGRLFASPG